MCPPLTPVRLDLTEVRPLARKGRGETRPRLLTGKNSDYCWTTAKSLNRIAFSSGSPSKEFVLSKSLRFDDPEIGIA